jgi:hypothetical protein
MVPNSFAVDKLLRPVSSSKKLKLLRLGHSLTDTELNEKYSIDHLSGGIQTKERSEIIDEAKKSLLEACQVLFITPQ